MKYIHLPLKGAYNVRDLGGYAADGGYIHFNKFIRGDSLSHLTKEDIQLLKDYGIKTILDLRGDTEIKKNPDKIVDDLDFTYKNISLFGGIKRVSTEDLTKVIVENPNEFLMKMYIAALEESKEFIKKVIDYMAECEEGGILFHCTGGKDRTGNISALLLGLAGVKRADIVANYEVTYTYLKESPEIRKQIQKYPEELIHSKAIYITNLLYYINENYNNAENYLIKIGVSDSNIQKLKEKLIKKIK